jgi:hypothetical protein
MQRRRTQRRSHEGAAPQQRRRSIAGAAQATINHEVIRRWVEEHGGHPAQVRRTGRGETGVLRIDYPGYSGRQTLEAISWDQFFDKFDQSDLAFLYQDRTKTGRESRFSKLVKRETATLH